MAISVVIPDLDFVPRGSLERDAYVTHQDTQFGILSGSWGTAMSTLKTQVNDTQTAINAKEVSVTNLTNLTIQYEGITKGYVNTCLAYKTASETAYQNTVTLIENTDISGTAGYTIEAVDSIVDDIELEQFLNFNLN